MQTVDPPRRTRRNNLEKNRCVSSRATGSDPKLGYLSGSRRSRRHFLSTLQYRKSAQSAETVTNEQNAYAVAPHWSSSCRLRLHECQLQQNCACCRNRKQPKVAAPYEARHLTAGVGVTRNSRWLLKPAFHAGVFAGCCNHEALYNIQDPPPSPFDAYPIKYQFGSN
jgi:hypothetical protein